MVDDRFPDSKFSKQRVKSLLLNYEVTIGAHIARNNSKAITTFIEKKQNLAKQDVRSCSSDSTDYEN